MPLAEVERKFGLRVCFGSLADIVTSQRHIRFTPKSGRVENMLKESVKCQLQITRPAFALLFHQPRREQTRGGPSPLNGLCRARLPPLPL
jgi:hypothetical protein